MYDRFLCVLNQTHRSSILSVGFFIFRMDAQLYYGKGEEVQNIFIKNLLCSEAHNRHTTDKPVSLCKRDRIGLNYNQEINGRLKIMVVGFQFSLVITNVTQLPLLVKFLGQSFSSSMAIFYAAKNICTFFFRNSPSPKHKENPWQAAERFPYCVKAKQNSTSPTIPKH